MRRLVFGRDLEVSAWVLQHIKLITPEAFRNSTAIGLAENGALIAGCVYHNYEPRWKALEMSIASVTPRWATKHTIGAFLRYPFQQLGCRRVTACVSIRNKRTIEFLKGIGFKQEGKIRRGFGNHDCLVFGMLRKEAARWINTAGEEPNG